MNALFEHVRVGACEQHVLVMVGLDSKNANVGEAFESLWRQNACVGAVTYRVYDASIRASEKIKTHAHGLANVVRSWERAYLNVWHCINMNRTHLVNKGKGYA